MLLGPYASKPLLVLTGYLWPAYQTYKAVAVSNKEDLRTWAIYWLVMGLYLSVEWLLDLTVFWLPLYYEFKLLLLLFLWHPRTQGATLVYEKFVQPLLSSNEARIDSTLEETKARIADGVTRQASKARDTLTGNAAALLEGMRKFSDQKPARGKLGHGHAD